MNSRVKEVLTFLRSKFPKAACELNYKSNYELLVAVILSAQCTDKRVNLITKQLFEKYPTAKIMANANLLDIENEIKSCGFYHNKAKSIISACKDIVDMYNGEVPSEMDKLIKLRGVGRKTANVIISVGFGGDAIAVDTHVFRVSRRLLLADEKTPEKVELQLQKVIDKKDWTEMHYLMVLFGRYICKSQRPLCEECKLKDICKYYQNRVK
ncbi:MAG: endonuclease III [Clostridia bacterium]|nr:endonuclease III [Clostridia bacterium]